jgi:rhamnulokinase
MDAEDATRCGASLSLRIISARLPLSDSPAYCAVDIGAESGRVLVGRLRDGAVELEEAHRFLNRPVRLPDGLRWDLLHLFTQALLGLGAAAGRAPGLRGVAVDTWAVDYALVDERRRALGLPFHYRDPRTEGMVERAFARVPAAELYAVTGIQTLPINTVFQLLADEGSAALSVAQRIALVPDLLSLWMSGELANERTVASSTGLLDARTGAWAGGLIERLGLPARIFGELVDPGTVLGPLLAHHELGAIPVIATAAHDTAAAFAAAPIADEGAAILSSGTWSLLGLELPAPVLSDVARAANLANERGIEGTTRLLKNVMGLWLVQECRRAWGQQRSYPELMQLAAAVADDDVALFDPDDPAFLAPGDMPARIAAATARSGERMSAEAGCVIRSILVSLACKYRHVLDQLEQATGRSVTCLHVIGGGARNALLCGLTADLTGRPVKAGPVEATALGNVLVQARATGELGSMADLRAVAAASSAPIVHEPGADRDRADAIYRRFLAVTGLPALNLVPGASP